MWNNIRQLFQNRKVFADFEIGAAADLLRQRFAFRRLHAERADTVGENVGLRGLYDRRVYAVFKPVLCMGRNADTAERNVRADALNLCRSCGACAVCCVGRNGSTDREEAQIADIRFICILKDRAMQGDRKFRELSVRRIYFEYERIVAFGRLGINIT